MDRKSKYEQMQEAIDAAWASNDENAQQLQMRIFPEGKPDVDAFVTRIADFLRENNLTF